MPCCHAAYMLMGSVTGSGSITLGGGGGGDSTRGLDRYFGGGGGGCFRAR
jgi:hypothetical protein